MADEFSDDKFKAEVLRFIEVASQKFDGLIADGKTNSIKIDSLIADVDGLMADGRTNSFKVDGIITDVRTNSFKLDRLESKIDGVENGLDVLTSDVRVLGGQFKDVAVMAIKDKKRIDDLEQTR